MTHEVELQLGFGMHVEARKVDVPDGDAPPWDATTKFQTVGTDFDRVDGLAKASGRARYSYDINLPGLLHGVILRSPVAKGVLKTLELDGARAMPGVAAVVALKQVGNKIRFVGDEIAAIAAATIDQARDALARIRHDYDAEAHNVDWLDQQDAPKLDDAGNIDAPWPANASVDAALDGADVIHAGTYRTEVQTHSSLETHGNVARWNGDDLEMWASTQATFGVRGVGRALQQHGVKVGNIEVHSEFIGGGFGSKFSPGVEGLAVALLAKEARSPVKLMLDRFEEHTCTGNRPASLMQIRAGATKDGKLVAWDFRSFGGPGYSGRGGNVTFPLHYLAEAARAQSHKDLATDTDPARSMRAPGYPQGYFGGELFLDELAHRLGLDPLALRRLNDPQIIRAEQWQLGAERFGWQQRRNPKPGSPMPGDDARMLRGAGLASARWGGLGGGNHGVTCRIHKDGKVEVRNGAQDIGTGMKTVMAMLAAEEFGIAPALVTAVMGHTSDPSGPASGGSTTTPSLAPVVRHAAWLAKLELAKLVARHLGCNAEDVRFEQGKVGAGAPMLGWDDACKLIGPNPIEVRGERKPNYKGQIFNDGVCGCQFAEVLVDSWTGEVRVTRMLAVQDCGLVIAKKQAESQVLGAMIQGIGYALHEQRILDKTMGRMLNGDFSLYKVPGAKDMPEMEAVMFSVANGHTNTGACGLGEPPSVAAPAAIANAVYNAIGVPVRHLPITPDKVMRALQQRKGV